MPEEIDYDAAFANDDETSSVSQQASADGYSEFL